MGIVSASDGRKTQIDLNMFSKKHKFFGHMYVVYKADISLYQFLQQTIGADKITFYSQLSKFSPLTGLPKDKQLLVIFDDCVTYPEKQQGIIKELYVRGRKIGRGVSMC